MGHQLLYHLFNHIIRLGMVHADGVWLWEAAESRGRFPVNTMLKLVALGSGIPMHSLHVYPCPPKTSGHCFK